MTVYDHRRSPGRKFLLAGRSGLNITHAEPLDQFVARYVPQHPQLERALRAFTPNDLRDWCQSLGEPTFVGSSGRVFPESFRTAPLLRSWLRRLDDHGVRLQVGHRWRGWTDEGHLRFESDSAASTVVSCDAAIFALGGPSWPHVSSDGGWAHELARAGIAMTPFAPANCGVHVAWSQVLRDRFEGAPIKNATFSVGDVSARGDVVITATGLEGGPIYALGPALREQLASGAASVVIDLHPDLPIDQLTGRLSKRRAKASVSSWLRSAGISDIAVSLAREVTSNSLPEQPADLARLLKTLPVPIDAMQPIDRAISAAGGVRFDAIDDNWMLIERPGSFVAGEMIDWEAPTGGYLLQACFSTAVAAAQGALAWCSAQASN